MKLDELIAIDVHTHAEVSCRQEPDEAWKPYEEASSKYFKAGSKRPNIQETIAYYQTASYLYRHDAYKAVSPEDQAKYRREAGLAPMAAAP